MSDLTVVCYVTRPTVEGGPLSPLMLHDPPNYRVVSAGPGAVSWRRQVATSPFVHGETQVGAVKDVGRVPLTIRAYGSSPSVLDANVAAMLRAFEQFEYDLFLSIDGVSWTWVCNPADYAPGDGGSFEKFGMMNYQQEYRFDVPRHPIPTAGTQ